jgi:nitrogen-specific signal transduction histidine kinase
VSGADHSLLAWLDAPIVVGDPQGRAVYANPAFEARFERARKRQPGLPLAELFEGGAREAVLRAVVNACQHGESVRFRVRDREVGYAAVASPIAAEGEPVGVVILLKEEVEGVERLLALHREIQVPLDDLSGSLDQLLEQTGGRRDPRHRALVEDGLRSVARLRKWSEEMAALLAGAPAPTSARRLFDPVRPIRRVADRIGRDAGEIGVVFQLLVPSALPEIGGDEDRMEALLLRILRRRLEREPAPKRLTVGARATGAGSGRAVLISVTEQGDFVGGAPPNDPPVDLESVAALGGLVRSVFHRDLGRTVLIRLPVPPA